MDNITPGIRSCPDYKMPPGDDVESVYNTTKKDGKTELLTPTSTTDFKINMDNDTHTGPGMTWIPGPTGFEPTELFPRRFEFRQIKDNMMYLDYLEQENCIGVASKMTRTYGHRFWGEFFAFLMPVFDFVFALVLEAFGFVLKVVMHLVLGILVRISDFLFKPILAVGFNAFTIPSLTHVQSVLSAAISATRPAIDLAERLLHMAAIPLKAFRLMEINKTEPSRPFNI